MYLFLIYNDNQRKNLCAWYKFSKIKDIIEFSGNLFRYSDVVPRGKIYKTYKTHFHIVDVTPLEKYTHFKSAWKPL